MQQFGEIAPLVIRSLVFFVAASCTRLLYAIYAVWKDFDRVVSYEWKTVVCCIQGDDQQI